MFDCRCSNNDDHPRNHAVLRTGHGWRLAPAYDLVPAPLVGLERRDLAMTVGTFGRAASIYNLISQCGRFGLTAEAARKEIENIIATVRAWPDHFCACGVSERDIEYIAQAFLPDCFFIEKPVHVLN